jgi:DNA-directed RNA polymerase specialized sigma24 family protein
MPVGIFVGHRFMPDLELLKSGDNDEIRLTIAEYNLVELARQAVWSIIGANYPGDVDRLAYIAITYLFTDAIHGCNSVGGIKPCLKQVAIFRALDFLDEAFRRRATEQLDNLELFQEPAESPFAFLGDILAEGLGLQQFELDEVVAALCELCELDGIQQALLVEHVIGGMTQEQFAEKHGLPFRGIGGRKERLLEQMRLHLSRASPVIAEIILRRNRRRIRRRNR